MYREFLLSGALVVLIDVTRAVETSGTTTAVVCVLTLTRIIKSVVTGQAPVTLEWRNTPGKKYKQTKSGTRILHVFLFLIFFARFYFLASGQAVVTGVSSLLPYRFLPSIFVAHRVQQTHCSSFFHRVLLTHALALSASQFVHKKKSQRFYTSMHSAGLELTNLIYTRLEDNLIGHRGDWVLVMPIAVSGVATTENNVTLFNIQPALLPRPQTQHIYDRSPRWRIRLSSSLV